MLVDYWVSVSRSFSLCNRRAAWKVGWFHCSMRKSVSPGGVGGRSRKHVAAVAGIVPVRGSGAVGNGLVAVGARVGVACHRCHCAIIAASRSATGAKVRYCTVARASPGSAEQRREPRSRQRHDYPWVHLRTKKLQTSRIVPVSESLEAFAARLTKLKSASRLHAAEATNSQTMTSVFPVVVSYVLHVVMVYDWLVFKHFNIYGTDAISKMSILQLAGKQLKPRPVLHASRAFSSPAPCTLAVPRLGAGVRLAALGGVGCGVCLAVSHHGGAAAGCEATPSAGGSGARGSPSLLDDLKKFFGLPGDDAAPAAAAEAPAEGKAPATDGKGSSDGKGEGESKAQAAEEEVELANDGAGPGKRVKVELDPEVVASLPVMPLAEVQAANGLHGGGGGGGGEVNRSAVESFSCMCMSVRVRGEALAGSC